MLDNPTPFSFNSLYAISHHPFDTPSLLKHMENRRSNVAELSKIKDVHENGLMTVEIKWEKCVKSIAS